MRENKILNRLLSLLLFCSLLIPTVVAARSSDPPNVQGYLQTLAATHPDDRVTVIVQKHDHRDTAEQIVLANGGQVMRQLPLINAFTATMTAKAVMQLARSATIKWIALDAPILSQTGGAPGTLLVLDDFATVAYNGDDGSFGWQGDWEEVGEADGAAVGDVAVTTFWGGALQGLRLQNAEKGALRRVDLAETSAAQLTVTYRRKSFLSENDYVALALSTDGGSSWTEVTRWAGPITDDALQNETIDISAYHSAQTLLRFMTAPGLNAEARFYLDRVNVSFMPTGGQTSTTAYQSYLPLVVNAGSEGINAAGPDQIAKADASGEVTAAACSYQCIDLNALQSTYVKAIRASELWNVAPYPRGDGVTVAVVDSGISPHPDFNDYGGVSRIIGRVNFTPDNFTPDDFYGHGTHIAGTIAGLGQASNQRYLGVAPEAKLVDVKVMDDWGYGTTSGVIAGLQWIYDNRALYNIKVVNLSLNSRVNESYHESALSAALEVLWFNKITVVVSAGNGGKQRLYPPANDPFVITVGAADDAGTAAITDDTLPAFSAYGMTADGFLKPDLVAPGANIVAPLSGDDNNLIWAHPENKMPAPYSSGYYKMSGTSMAAGVVAGAVAVLLEDEPNLTPDQVKYRLLATARPFSGGGSCATGAGYLDLYSAVNGTTTQSANTNLQASQLLWSGTNPVTWGSVSWNSVSWNSVSWNSVSWNSVSWNSVSWNSVSWNSSDFGSGNGNGSCTAAIKKMILVDADTGRDLQPLYDGAVLNIDQIGTRNLSIRVETAGMVESVKFDLNQAAFTHIENVEPYSLAAKPYVFANGLHTFKTTTYAADNGGGAPGAELTIQFTVAGTNRCELEGTVRSVTATTPMRFQLENKSTAQLELFWLDYDGQRQSYGLLAPGRKLAMLTYVSHPWLIARDWDNSCLRLVPDPGMESAVTITNDDLVTNLLIDGGFETGSNSNWGRSTGAAVQSNNARSGRYTMLITGDNRGIWQAVTGLQPNTTYRARAYLKAGSAGNAGHLFIKNYGGAHIDTWSQGKLVNTKEYTEVSLTLTTGPTSKSADIGIWRSQQGSGDLYIDDLQLAKVTFSGPVVLQAKHSSKVLDVAGVSKSDGANVQQWTYNGGANQKWRIEALTTGAYQVVAIHSGKCLDLAGGSLADGANVQQWSCNGSVNQQWRVELLSGSTYQLVSMKSNKCLDVASAGTANGTNVQQWSCSGAANQSWRIWPTK